ncbi:MAG: ssDNA exonuclease RecJ [Methanomassiliicoccales archaeon PtaU1.Bin124]|nr:MAG: ssDNA exonuclease RecJ [Methanomassiliicoccales archaeon PtaU1.Bin124]
MGDRKGFEDRAQDLAVHLLASKEVLVIGHIDADGITAASIAMSSLKRARIKSNVRFVKRIDQDEASRINKERADTVWLVDLGSGYASRLTHPGLCISDHHAPDRPCSDHDHHQARQTTLFDVNLQLNPMDFGFDGSREMSGAGATYFVAKAMNPHNKDLASLAVVGALGDFQDNDDGRLIGMNQEIVADGVAAGTLDVKEDIRLYGRETRPLTRLIQFSDLQLPWTSDWQKVKDFFWENNVPLGRRDNLRTWSSLSDMERFRVRDVLMKELAALGKDTSRLWGEVYLLPREKVGTELHDAKEYGTLLNSCGRHDDPELGMGLCIADRKDVAFPELLARVHAKLDDHRKNLRGGLELLNGAKLERLDSLQYYRTENGYGLPRELETTLGSILGMALGSGKVCSDVPLIGFAYTSEGPLKVSARGTKELVSAGLDLSSAMRQAAAQVGGAGGGHNIAAGATISIGQEMEFLKGLDDIITAQIRR